MNRSVALKIIDGIAWTLAIPLMLLAFLVFGLVIVLLVPPALIYWVVEEVNIL